MQATPRLIPLVLALLLAAGCGGGKTSESGGGGAVATGACDRAALEASAAEIQGRRAAWTPERGTLPDETLAAAGAIWRACPALPQGLRVYLDTSTDHPEGAWVRDGTPRPAEVEDPLAAILPGHAQFHRPTVPIMGDPAIQAILEAVCPGAVTIAGDLATLPGDERSAALFDRCDLGRHGLLSREQVIAAGGQFPAVYPFVVDRWLTGEGGAPPEVAHALARELAMNAAIRSSMRPAPDQKLPFGAAPAAPAGDGWDFVVHAGPAAIHALDRKVAALEDGAVEPADRSGPLIGALFDGLAEEADKALALAPAAALRLVVIGDRSLSAGAAAAIVYTARKAGFAAIDAMIVTAEGPVHLGLVPLESGGEASPPAITATLAAGAIRVACGEGEAAEAPADAAAIQAAIGRCGAQRGAVLGIVVGVKAGYPQLIAVANAGREAGLRVTTAAADEDAAGSGE